MYLAAYKADTLKYGILPDSIFEIINKNAFRLFNDTAISNKNKECMDCSEISILATYKNDTIRLVQKGDLSDSIFFPLIDANDKHLLTSKSRSKFNVFPQLKFETAELILPPLTPAMEPPIRKRKKA